MDEAQWEALTRPLLAESEWDAVRARLLNGGPPSAAYVNGRRYQWHGQMPAHVRRALEASQARNSGAYSNSGRQIHRAWGEIYQDLTDELLNARTVEQTARIVARFDVSRQAVRAMLGARSTHLFTAR